MEKTELLAFRVEPQLAFRLKQAATEHERPYAWVIRKALESYLSPTNDKPVSISNLAERADNGFAPGVHSIPKGRGEPL